MRSTVIVPAPATVRPKVSSRTVTPVILARSEIPFHHRSKEACIDIAGLRDRWCRTRLPITGAGQTLAALSMYPNPRLVWIIGSFECWSSLRRRYEM